MTAYVRGISAVGRSANEDVRKQRDYTVIYYVYTDDRNDGAQSVGNAFGVPQVGDLYITGNDADVRAKVVSRRITQRESPWEWEVEVNYAASMRPTEEPAEIAYSFQTRRIVVPGRYNDPDNPEPDKDLELGIVSSNGELFDPQPELELAEPVLTITKNVEAFNSAELMQLANTVNRDAFMGAEERQLRMMPPQATRGYDPEHGFYWKLTYSLAYKYDTWDLQLLNVGSYWVDSDVPTPFLDVEGNRFVGLLKADGTAINSSDPHTAGRYISTGDEVSFTRLRIYREIDFNSLGLT